MHETELLSPYATKALEYGLAILYLALFVPFWRYLNAPARARASSTAWRFADWFYVPDGVHLHKGHAWARPETGGVAVGLDDFGHDLVGPLEGVELPTLGRRVKQGEPAFALRAAGRTIPLRAPVSGTVVAVNEAAASAPAVLHDDPYGAGWLFRVEPRRLSKSLKSLITGEKARAHAMRLRAGSDAILVGVNTIRADDPSLTVRSQPAAGRRQKAHGQLRRIILDSKARTPLTARVVSDGFAALTTIVVTKAAPPNRVAALAKKVRVWVAPVAKVGRAVLSPPRRRGADTAPHSGRIDLRWLLRRLGAEDISHLLVEGGGEVNASFLLEGLAHRVAFFYAPKILGGRDARKAVGGEGVKRLEEIIRLRELEWRRLGPDLLLNARVVGA